MLKSFYKTGQFEAGCDEAGRGCLAGPVVAAAVILPQGYSNEFINDSKQINEKRRFELAEIIKKDALAWAICEVSHQEIDKINILNASIAGMQRAVDKLKVKPDFLLIDGNRFKKHRDIPHLCVIKGDATYMSIAAASLLAKTHRDEIMMDLHEKMPHYGWDKNKGYPTKLHRSGIKIHGPSPYHRLSFTLLPPQLSLFEQE